MSTHGVIVRKVAATSIEQLSQIRGLNHALRIFGITAVLTVKVADIIVALMLLEEGFRYEINPIVLWMFEQVGIVPVVISVMTVTLVVVVGVTEFGAERLRIITAAGVYPAVVRVIGYGGTFALTALALSIKSHLVIGALV